MSNAIVEIRHRRTRALTQSLVYLVVLIICLAMLGFGITFIIPGGAAGIILGGILGLLGLVGALISGAVIWTFAPAVLGRAEPALIVDDWGIRWHQGLYFAWTEVSGLTIETDDSISFAGGADAAIDRALENAMAAGGVGDGSRSIVVELRDARAARAAAGPAAFLIDDGHTSGTGSARFILDGIADPATFAQAASSLVNEAERRGIPAAVRTG